jgi:hypothetical protein
MFLTQEIRRKHLSYEFCIIWRFGTALPTVRTVGSNEVTDVSVTSPNAGAPRVASPNQFHLLEVDNIPDEGDSEDKLRILPVPPPAPRASRIAPHCHVTPPAQPVFTPLTSEDVFLHIALQPSVFIPRTDSAVREKSPTVTSVTARIALIFDC